MDEFEVVQDHVPDLRGQSVPMVLRIIGLCWSRVSSCKISTWNLLAGVSLIFCPVGNVASSHCEVLRALNEQATIVSRFVSGDCDFSSSWEDPGRVVDLVCVCCFNLLPPPST